MNVSTSVTILNDRKLLLSSGQNESARFVERERETLNRSRISVLDNQVSTDSCERMHSRIAKTSD